MDRLPSAQQIDQIAFAYPVEEDVNLFKSRPPWTNGGVMGLEDMAQVVDWKAPRLKTLFRDHNEDSRIRSVTRSALVPLGTVQEPADVDFEALTAAINQLSTIPYVKTRMATAILAVYRPRAFTVMDWRARDVLAAYGVTGVDAKASLDAPNTYVTYLRACHGLAREIGVSLRNLDRFLWVLGGTKHLSHETYLSLRKSESEPEAW